jgi:membrane protein DedA with SNARE-associated domain
MLELLSGLNHWQIDLIVVTILWQGAVFTLFPEEVILTTLGILWGRGQLGFFEAMVVAQLGLLPANAAMVTVCQKLGRKLFQVRPFSWFLKPEAVESASKYLRRYGDVMILATRFTPLIRGPMYASIGLSGFPIRRFMLLDALASCVQVPLLLWIGAKAGSAFMGAMGK